MDIKVDGTKLPGGIVAATIVSGGICLASYAVYKKTRNDKAYLTGTTSGLISIMAGCFGIGLATTITK